MQKRHFGSSSRDVAVIGQGTWFIEEGEPSVTVSALRRGVDLGMTHIDTAELYGSGAAEELVGQAIAGRRDEVFLVSKVLPDHASRAGVGYSPFGHKAVLPGHRTSRGRVLTEIAAAHGATVRQVVLAFLVRKPPLFTIPKASNPDHTAENAGAGELRLSEDELARIDEAFPLDRRARALPTL